MASNMALKEVLACFSGAFTGAAMSTLALDIFIRNKFTKTPQTQTLCNEERENKPSIIIPDDTNSNFR